MRAEFQATVRCAAALRHKHAPRPAVLWTLTCAHRLWVVLLGLRSLQFGEQGPLATARQTREFGRKFQPTLEELLVRCWCAHFV